MPSPFIATVCLKKRVAKSCPSGPCLLEQWMTTRFAKSRKSKPATRQGPSSAL